jgi:hypothetical protein
MFAVLYMGLVQTAFDLRIGQRGIDFCLEKELWTWNRDLGYMGWWIEDFV